jgi:cyclophilin family peptidyl-prolyl cis-trans isomerase
MGRKAILFSISLVSIWLFSTAFPIPQECNDLLSVCMNPSSCPILTEQPPSAFEVMYKTTKGNFVINVESSWAPPYAQRFWALSKLNYMNGSSFYRVDYISPNQSFVVQFGYNGNPSVDQCWDNNLTSDKTWSVHPPGNIRGTVSFAMGATNQTQTNPNCTSTEYCAQGFSTNIFINYANNRHLNAPGFSPFGWISDSDMKVVDSLYNGYGDCSELCGDGSTDPYCVGVGAECSGVSMTQLVQLGDNYLTKYFPRLDCILSVSIQNIRW